MSDRKLGLNQAVRDELDRMIESSDAALVYYVGPPADGYADDLRNDWLRRGGAIAEYISAAKGVPYAFDADAQVVRPVPDD